MNLKQMQSTKENTEVTEQADGDKKRQTDRQIN